MREDARDREQNPSFEIARAKPTRLPLAEEDEESRFFVFTIAKP